MKAILGHITRAGLLLSMAAGALLLSSCGVNEPEATPWQDVSNFSWPTQTGTFMRYRVEDKVDTTAPDTEVQSVKRWIPSFSPFRPEFLTSERFPDQQVYVLSDSVNGPSFDVYFLPLKDTLVAENDPTGAHFALVAPLERNHSWIASDEPAIKATLLERFSALKLNGTTYHNVIVVKYEPTGDSKQDYYSIRFFAERVGPILTKHYSVSVKNAQDLGVGDPQAVMTRTLVETNALQN